MSLRIAVALTILATLIIVAVYPLFSGDEPPPPDPIETIEPSPPVVVPGNPIAPATPETTHKDPITEPAGVAGDSCVSGQCPAPSYQPEQRSFGTRRLFQRRFR